jgi:hypothetical protein
LILPPRTSSARFRLESVQAGCPDAPMPERNPRDSEKASGRADFDPICGGPKGERPLKPSPTRYDTYEKVGGITLLTP